MNGGLCVRGVDGSLVGLGDSLQRVRAVVETEGSPGLYVVSTSGLLEPREVDEGHVELFDETPDLLVGEREVVVFAGAGYGQSALRTFFGSALGRRLAAVDEMKELEGRLFAMPVNQFETELSVIGEEALDVFDASVDVSEATDELEDAFRILRMNPFVPLESTAVRKRLFRLLGRGPEPRRPSVDSMRLSVTDEAIDEQTRVLRRRLRRDRPYRVFAPHLAGVSRLDVGAGSWIEVSTATLETVRLSPIYAGPSADDSRLVELAVAYDLAANCPSHLDHLWNIELAARCVELDLPDLVGVNRDLARRTVRSLPRIWNGYVLPGFSEFAKRLAGMLGETIETVDAGTYREPAMLGAPRLGLNNEGHDPTQLPIGLDVPSMPIDLQRSDSRLLVSMQSPGYVATTMFFRAIGETVEGPRTLAIAPVEQDVIWSGEFVDLNFEDVGRVEVTDQPLRRPAASSIVDHRWAVAMSRSALDRERRTRASGNVFERSWVRARWQVAANAWSEVDESVALVARERQDSHDATTRVPDFLVDHVLGLPVLFSPDDLPA